MLLLLFSRYLAEQRKLRATVEKARSGVTQAPLKSLFESQRQDHLPQSRKQGKHTKGDVGIRRVNKP